MSKTKQDMIEFIAEKVELSKADAEKAVNAFTDYVTSTLAEGGKFGIVGWGSFETSQRAARDGRNPQTGATIKIPAATVPKFKAGKKLKDAVNK